MSAFIACPGVSGRESFRLRRFLMAALACSFLAVAGPAAEPPRLKVPAVEAWKIEITPGPAIGPSPVPNVDRAIRQAQIDKSEALENSASTTTGVVTAGIESALPGGITSASYLEVYNSIPFRRSEYAANPNYRHEATIELLLGQIRPKAVTNVSVPAATCCSPEASMFVRWFSPWGSNSFDDRKSRYRP